MSILGLQPEVEPRDQVFHLADVQNRSFTQPRPLMGAAQLPAREAKAGSSRV